MPLGKWTQWKTWREKPCVCRQTAFDYLLIKRKLWTIDPWNCDTMKSRKPSAKTHGMIDDFLQLHWPSFMRNIFEINWRAHLTDIIVLQSLPPVTYTVYNTSVQGTRSKWTTLALLRPFATMKSRIKTSTNHGTVFQLPPHHNATLLFPECHCPKVKAAF